MFQAADEANRNFDLYCKTLGNSDPSAFEDTAIAKLAAWLLAQRGLSTGEFARVKTDALAFPQIGRQIGCQN